MKKIMYLLNLLVILLYTENICSKVDLISFSYHRPMQLYAHLESIYKNFNGLGSVTVLWRADREDFKKAYEEVFASFPQVNSLQEGLSTDRSLKNLLVTLTQQCLNNHIMFGVDDIIVTRTCNLEQAVAMKEKHGAYAFFLRLGKNIDYTYMMNLHTPLPKHHEEKDSCILWKFIHGQGDWAYPNSLDMAIYNKSTVLKFLENNNNFKKAQKVAPNSIEGFWAGEANLSLKGICFEHSVILNIPVNLVNQVWTANRHANLYNVDDLLLIFNSGKKIDIAQFQGIDNKSPHEEHAFSFINRN